MMGLFWRRVMVVALLLWAGGVQAGVYQVDGLEISVPLPQPKSVAPQQMGLEMARQEAFIRLQRRLLTSWDQETLKDFLANAARDMDKLLERVVLHSEKRRAAKLDLQVEIAFSRPAITRLLSDKGFSYCETPMPPALLVVLRSDKEGVPRLVEGSDPLLTAFMETGKEQGLLFFSPVGDMEEVVNLTWERIVAGDSDLRQWALRRYGAEELWVVHDEKITANDQRLELALVRVKASGVENLSAQITASQAATLTAAATPATVPATATGNKDPIALLRKGIARQMLVAEHDRWIKDHLVVPELRHGLALRVVHWANTVGFGSFYKQLRTVPGVGGVRFVRQMARETHLELEFEGQNEQLLTLLRQKGYAVSVGNTATGGVEESVVVEIPALP